MKKGFTLIEVLAVITILAIIALITVPAVGKTIKKQKMKTFQINVKSLIKTCEEDFITNDLQYPITYTYNDGTVTRPNGDSTIEISFAGKISNVEIATITFNNASSVLLTDMTDGSFNATYTDGEVVISEN